VLSCTDQPARELEGLMCLDSHCNRAAGNSYV
jgi:hypothetical protein